MHRSRCWFFYFGGATGIIDEDSIGSDGAYERVSKISRVAPEFTRSPMGLMQSPLGFGQTYVDSESSDDDAGKSSDESAVGKVYLHYRGAASSARGSRPNSVDRQLTGAYWPGCVGT